MWSGRSRVSGFTFVELMMALAVASSIVAVAYTFFSFVMRGSSRGDASIQLTQSIRIASELIASDIRSAIEVSRLNSDSLTLKLEKPPENVSRPDLSSLSVHQTVRYFWKEEPNGMNSLIREVDGRTTRAMFTVEKMSQELFQARSYDRNNRLIVFNTRENDSYLRSRISFISVNYEVQHRDLVFERKFRVSPRNTLAQIRQPWWNRINY